ncbi:MAG: hypothetical protein ABJN72_16300 [Sulfitobacter sp.]
MHIGNSLKDRHEALADHFADLAGARDQLPLFAIEHGLDEAALEELRTAVSGQLEADPQLQGAAWSWSYLPLLVMATEVGYRYCGTGTDFWPVLAQELGVEAGSAFRSGLSRLFDLGHRSFRLARPSDSPWERHFPHIAWPIGNALVPLEIQPQLTNALRRSVRAGISAENMDGLLEYLKMLAAGHASRRFENWLQQEDIAAEVMRRLLAPDAEGWLSQDILQRIDNDIRKDLSSHRAISEARKAAARRSARVAAIVPSQFVMTLVDSVPKQLLVRGPALPSQSRDEVIATLRIQGDRIRAAGSDQTIALRSFLAGGEIGLGKFTGMPTDPLSRGDAAHVEQGPAYEALESLQPLQSAFFLIERGERTARTIFPDEALAPNASMIQLLRIDHDGTPEFRWLETSSGADVELLRRNGFKVSDKAPSLRLLGLLMSGAQNSFLRGVPVLAAQSLTHRTLQLDGVQPASETLRLQEDDWSVFVPGVGRHWVGPADGDDHDRVEFEVVEPPDLEPASISIFPANANISDLEAGRLEIRVTAPLNLEEVPVRLRLRSAGEPEAISEGVIDRLPARITGHSPLIRALRAQLAEGSAGLSDLRLTVNVHGLMQLSISLPPLRREFHHDNDLDHWISTNEDGRVLPSMVATLQSPIPRTSEIVPPGTRLILPDATDHGALASGLIISERSEFHIGIHEADSISFPALLREASSRNNGVGLIDLARANVAWQLAQASDPFGNWRRWSGVEALEETLIELLCGVAWRKLESGIDLSILSQHGALLRSAEALGLVSGEDLPEIKSNSDQLFLRDRLIARLRETVPDITDALARLDDELAGDLDLAVIDSYEDLRRQVQAGGREAFEEVDMARSSTTWRKALERARDIPLLPMFRHLILPEARWKALMNTWYAELTEDDLVDLLDSCHVDAFRRPGLRWLDRAELRTMLQLWLSPRAMIEADEWPRFLAKGLSDIQTSRAVRYVALRRKLALLDMPDGSPM